MKGLLSWKIWLGLAAAYLFALDASRGAPVTIQETGMGANEIVTISSSTIGRNVQVYAGALDILVNGTATYGFCIDPWQWSGNGPLSYNTEALTTTSKLPAPLDAGTSLKIEQLWAKYYSPTIGNSAAAGLQIAIWDLVAASVSASTNGASWFQLNSSNDYGASTDLAWVNSHPTATAADLVALSGPGQTYAVASSSVPRVTYTLAIAGSPSAGGSSSGAGTYDAGTVVTVTETAASGYRTNGWGGTDGAQTAAPASATTTIVMNGNRSLTAQFVRQATLTVAAEAGGTATGGGTYDVGTVATITESAHAGYRTAGWAGPDGAAAANPSGASTTIVMSANRSLTASFVQQATLTVTSGTGGTASGGGIYDVGSTVAISATPGSHYAFNDWTGGAAGNAQAASTVVTLNADETVMANFSALPQPPTAIINSAATAFTGSPFTVTSTAGAPDNNLTLHSVEWLSPSGAWTSDTASASGGSSSRSVGITFPATGVWTLRAGASVDNGVTWVYSPSVQVTVSAGLVTYALQTMAVPAGAANLTWYAPSPVVTKSYQVRHVNP